MKFCFAFFLVFNDVNAFSGIFFLFKCFFSLLKCMYFFFLVLVSITRLNHFQFYQSHCLLVMNLNFLSRLKLSFGFIHHIEFSEPKSLHCGCRSHFFARYVHTHTASGGVWALGWAVGAEHRFAPSSKALVSHCQRRRRWSWLDVDIFPCQIFSWKCAVEADQYRLEPTSHQAWGASSFCRFVIFFLIWANFRCNCK